MKIAPSILAADWLNLSEEVSKVEAAGADLLHLDVMDGSFVPAISYGQDIIKAIKKVATTPLDVHLMVNNPESLVDSFVDAGASILTFHVEATKHPHRLLQYIRSKGVSAGLALNPGTNIDCIEDLLDEMDLLLIMTVNPGWGGQKFIQNSILKIDKAKALIGKRQIEIEVDGGINENTGKICAQHGASVLVAGTYVFGSKNYAESIGSLR